MGILTDSGVTEIQEDYLEAILVLEEENRVARLTDIARHLRLSKSTVSTTLGILKKHGFVVHEPYKPIALTPSGRRIARRILRRHEALRTFLVEVLLLDEKTADETACKMEHGIPRSAVERLVQFTEFVQECPHRDKAWLKGFGFYCVDGQRESCDRCLESTPGGAAKKERER
jgi:DtxR family Mn-dependent transcriptional regulator